jgi:hypothetical protein
MSLINQKEPLEREGSGEVLVFVLFVGHDRMPLAYCRDEGCAEVLTRSASRGDVDYQVKWVTKEAWRALLEQAWG